MDKYDLEKMFESAGSNRLGMLGSECNNTIKHDIFRVGEGLKLLSFYAYKAKPFASIFIKDDCLCVPVDQDIRESDSEFIQSIGWVYDPFEKHWYLSLSEYVRVELDETDDWAP